jgi:hypothetical protein
MIGNGITGDRPPRYSTPPALQLNVRICIPATARIRTIESVLFVEGDHLFRVEYCSSRAMEEQVGV